MVRAYRRGRIAAAAWILAVPAATFAQQTNAGITGIARDASGAVLPGVTVEASSSVLIERVRTVTTGGDGRYNIGELPPGSHTLGLSLPGFSAVKNESLGLHAGVPLTVNATMRVGALGETGILTRAPPIVDTQNV